ncbi:Hypothetical predicted protein [Mytilus galloprovincialis]|uniref:Uncharacterized protein n=1 Tax=Mytilus galloprovincialis TaxID=29158 RepID=A0A8B6F9B6_MYTGA|nr:Hypothetical predicted protein [Mytilus galloprovincialis]
MSKEVLHVCVMIVFFNITLCQNIDDYKRLYNDLFDSYNPELKPVLNNSDNMRISIQFSNLGINNFDEVDGILSLSATINMSWTDSSLKWNPIDYNNVTEISVFKSTVWFPYLLLINDIHKIKTFGANSLIKVFVQHDGSIIWMPGDIINSKCPANMKKFPFDEQECSLTFVVWDAAWQVFPQPAEIPYTDFYATQNPDWNILSTKVGINQLFGNMSYEVTLKIKRVPLYYNILLFLPITLLSLLNPLVFLLPHDSGERLSYGVTILLSFVIFLTLASDKIPATSNPISFLIVFIVMVFTTSAIIMFFNLINSYFFHKHPTEIRGFLQYTLKSMCRKRRKNQVMPLHKDIITYKDLASSLDKVCFVLSYVAMFLLIAIYFIVLLY